MDECFEFSVSARGIGRNYTTGRHQVFVRGMLDDLLRAELVSAVLTPSAEDMLLSFDMDTNRGGLLELEPYVCGDLFVFTSADTATCVWTSPRSVTATLARDAPMPLPGSPLRAQDTRLWTFCDESVVLTGDDGWCETQLDGTYVQNTVVVGLPSLPTLPVVSLSTALTVGGCDDVFLDATNSAGGLGRAWEVVAWKVTSVTDLNATRLSLAEGMLNNHMYTTNKETHKMWVLANWFVEQGHTYAISLSLTNALGLMSSTTVEVFISSLLETPRLRILGPSILNVARSKAISLFADAVVPSCAGSSNKMLEYTWKLYRDVQFMDGFVNPSLDPRVLEVSTILIADAYLNQLLLSINTYTILILLHFRSRPWRRSCRAEKSMWFRL